MNKIFVILFLLTFTAFPQTAKNILSLKNEIRQNIISGNSNSIPVKEEFSKKSVILAITYSLILPGMGELYAGNYSSGKYFTIAEGVFWGTYIGINTYSNWQKDRYHSFAASNGGVNVAGKDDGYFGNIGIYTDINEYNDDMAKNGEFSKMYDIKQNYWKWAGNDRKTYRAMWTSGEQWHNNLRFIVGALVLKIHGPERRDHRHARRHTPVQGCDGIGLRILGREHQRTDPGRDGGRDPAQAGDGDSGIHAERTLSPCVGNSPLHRVIPSLPDDR